MHASASDDRRRDPAGSARIRAYDWDWFGSGPNGRYSYPATLIRSGASETKKTFDWQIEFAAPLIGDLPTGAVEAAPKGQLGLGASY